MTNGFSSLPVIAENGEVKLASTSKQIWNTCKLLVLNGYLWQYIYVVDGHLHVSNILRIQQRRIIIKLGANLR